MSGSLTSYNNICGYLAAYYSTWPEVDDKLRLLSLLCLTEQYEIQFVATMYHCSILAATKIYINIFENIHG